MSETFLHFHQESEGYLQFHYFAREKLEHLIHQMGAC